jgi:GT2 family glycosyltransferase
MDCSTIIVSYNTFELTRKAIASALKAAPGLEHEVIVVDNDSPDQSGKHLQTLFSNDEFSEVTIIINEENRGFARANNQGADEASGDVLFFLNPDTVVHDEAIRTIYDFIDQNPAAGAVGPRVLNADGTVQSSVSSKVSPTSVIAHHLPLDALIPGQNEWRNTPTEITAVDIVKGCALAVRREVFDTVGKWDESYFMYAEERELCYAIQEAGFTNYYLPKASITHFGGASSEENYADQQLLHHRSAIQFLERHHSPTIRAVHRTTGIIGFGLRAVVFRILRYLRPNSGRNLQRRGEAATKLFWWFLLDYSSGGDKGT